ncbi:MoaD/ThiS family protein [Demetria terragena]|uniref:MoaD/ThiS family protein n=1 Tax=Demetria terragena TaxID=63959 RepID=UPI0003641D01|nr:MoaD/ThiS family protein [Demetria terragena]
MTTVTVRYWAGARAAAGIDHERVEADSVVALREAIMREHPAMTSVLDVASVLIDGRAVQGDAPLADAETVEILPPFAGG